MCVETRRIARDVATTTSFCVTSFGFGARRKSSAQLGIRIRGGRAEKRHVAVERERDANVQLVGSVVKHNNGEPRSASGELALVLEQ